MWCQKWDLHLSQEKFHFPFCAHWEADSFHILWSLMTKCLLFNTSWLSFSFPWKETQSQNNFVEGQFFFPSLSISMQNVTLCRFTSFCAVSLPSQCLQFSHLHQSFNFLSLSWHPESWLKLPQGLIYGKTFEVHFCHIASEQKKNKQKNKNSVQGILVKYHLVCQSNAAINQPQGISLL